MVRVNKVLCPTDFSERAGQAFAQALHLAEQFGAELHTLHAIVLHKADPYNPAFHFSEADEISSRLSQIASSEMTRLMQSHQAETAVKIHQIQERGIAAAPVILDYAQAHDIDLIVMATHGRRGPSRFFLGSVTEEVMRSAECPVFTLRESAEPVSNEAVQVILAPVDFSENSKSALVFARELAQIYGAQLHIKHVIEGRHHPEYLRPIGDRYVPNAPKLKGFARDRLQRFVKEVPGPVVPQVLDVSIGHTTTEILSLATTIEADLIVLGSQGFSGLENVFFGSTAEGVVRRAECSVLTVKAH